MKNHRLSIPDDDEHRVLQFRPRTSSAGKPASPAPNATPLQNDLSRYEQPRDAAQDDFRHRMLTLRDEVVCECLRFWLATSIADLRKMQDCVLMGRRDCATLPSPQG